MKATPSKLRFLLLPSILMLSIHGVHAERAQITVPGQADQTVLTDQLRISLEMTTESGSFAGAKSEADAVANRIRSELANLHSGYLDVSTHIQVVKHKKFSWSSKAKKLTHSVIVTLRDMDGKLPETAVAIVDATLKVDSRLELTDFRGMISDRKQAEVRASLLAAAVQHARASAELLAAEAGLDLSQPTAIHGTAGFQSGEFRARDFFLAPGVSDMEARNPSFTVYGNLVDELRMSVSLVVEFDAFPAR